MTDSAPLVSIVIPAYNHAGYLAQAIDSVLAQDYPRIELIVIDDGSTDATPQILRNYEGRAQIVRQQNAGQAATLNRGWAMARGELLGYLSADDVLDPAAVRAAVEALEAHPDIVLTYCDFELIDALSRPILTVRAEEFDYRRMVVDLICLPGPGAFFRRSAFETAGGWDPALRQMPDYDYWLRLGLVGAFKRIPHALAAFRVHEASTTFAETSPERAEETVRILEKYFGLAGVPTGIQHERNRAFSNALLVCAQLHLRAGRYAGAFGSLRQATALSPLCLLRPRTLRRLASGFINRFGHPLLWSVRRPRGPNPPA